MNRAIVTTRPTPVAHRYGTRGDANATPQEIAWGVALFTLATVVLIWLNVQFGVPITPVE